MVKQRKQKQQQQRRVIRARPRRMNTGVGGASMTPLLPQSINNRITSNASTKPYRFVGTEYMGQPITLTGNEAPGKILFNQIITTALCVRLAAQAKCWQRYTVNKLKGTVVTLNGSLVQSGYTMAYIDDPSYPIRTDSKGIVNLTAFKGSTVRQNWVSSSVSSTTKNGDRPPLFVQEGADPRLHSPGRLVLQLNGTPSADNVHVTWAIMLEYDITFHSPGVVQDAVLDNFEIEWVNNQAITMHPGNEFLTSASSPIGLRTSTRYYVNSPGNAHLWDGENNLQRWVIGFITGSTNADIGSSRLIITTDPNLPLQDQVNGNRPADNSPLDMFWVGTGFSLTRPTFFGPDLTLPPT